jgi:hypothetical protein
VSFILAALGLAAGLPAPLSEARVGDKIVVTGRAQAVGSLLRAPATDRECVFWRVRVAVQSARRPVAVIEQLSRFVVDDGSARVMVRPSDAAVAAVADASGECRIDELPSALRSLLDEALQQSGSHVVRWEESVIEASEQIEIAALLAVEPSSETDARHAPALIAPPGERLRITDRAA